MSCTVCKTIKSDEKMHMMACGHLIHKPCIYALELKNRKRECRVCGELTLFNAIKLAPTP